MAKYVIQYDFNDELCGTGQIELIAENIAHAKNLIKELKEKDYYSNFKVLDFKNEKE